MLERCIAKAYVIVPLRSSPSVTPTVINIKMKSSSRSTTSATCCHSLFTQSRSSDAESRASFFLRESLMAFNTIEKLVSKFSSLRIRCCTSGLRWACLSHGPSLLLLQSVCGISATEDELRLVVVRDTGLAGECCSALRSSPSTCLCC